MAAIWTEESRCHPEGGGFGNEPQAAGGGRGVVTGSAEPRQRLDSTSESGVHAATAAAEGDCDAPFAWGAVTGVRACVARSRRRNADGTWLELAELVGATPVHGGAPRDQVQLQPTSGTVCNVDQSSCGTFSAKHPLPPGATEDVHMRPRILAVGFHPGFGVLLVSVSVGIEDMQEVLAEDLCGHVIQIASGRVD